MGGNTEIDDADAGQSSVGVVLGVLSLMAMFDCWGG